MNDPTNPRIHHDPLFIHDNRIDELEQQLAQAQQRIADFEITLEIVNERNQELKSWLHPEFYHKAEELAQAQADAATMRALLERWRNQYERAKDGPYTALLEATSAFLAAHPTA